MDAGSFNAVPWIIRYSRQVHQVIIGSFVISILYNIVGIWFSVRAELEPVVAAILMPASSISIVLFTTGCTWLLARRWISRG
jgi:Cu+-exporting ATPase